MANLSGDHRVALIARHLVRAKLDSRAVTERQFADVAHAGNKLATSAALEAAAKRGNDPLSGR